MSGRSETKTPEQRLFRRAIESAVLKLLLTTVFVGVGVFWILSSANANASAAPAPPAAPAAPAAASECIDELPPSYSRSFSCKYWAMSSPNECARDAMQGYCLKSCNKCDAGAPTAVKSSAAKVEDADDDAGTTARAAPSAPAASDASVCIDELPPGATYYSCSQQASFGKCNESWMKGYCLNSCNKCGGAAQAGERASGRRVLLTDGGGVDSGQYAHILLWVGIAFCFIGLVFGISFLVEAAGLLWSVYYPSPTDSTSGSTARRNIVSSAFWTERWIRGGVRNLPHHQQQQQGHSQRQPPQQQQQRQQHQQHQGNVAMGTPVRASNRAAAGGGGSGAQFTLRAYDFESHRPEPSAPPGEPHHFFYN